MHTRPKIGVFDSGVGGLSILADLRAHLPQAQFFYCCDNRNLPYGTKSDTQVIEFTLAVTQRFMARYALDLLVIACNTASTIALPALRSRYDAGRVPVIGVVPAIKPAAAWTQTKTIGLLATPATVRRAYTDALIADFAAQCRVLRTGSHVLVLLAERKLRGESIPIEQVRDEIAAMFQSSPQTLTERLDVVVLGCTHFPLLLDELQQAAPWPVRWLAAGDAIAARTAHLLRERGLLSRDETEANLMQALVEPMPFLCTQLDQEMQALTPTLERLHFAPAELL